MSLSDFIPKRKPLSPRETWLEQKDDSMNSPKEYHGMLPNPDTPRPIIPSRDPRQVARSEEAARAAQHVLDLEASLNGAQHEINSLQGQLSVAIETSNALRTSLQHLREDNERLVRENVRVHSRVTIAAETIMAILREDSHRDETRNPQADASNAVAAALDNTTEEPHA